jgi:hypothetical protein
MRAIAALIVATAASLYGLYGPTFVPEPPVITAESKEQVQSAPEPIYESTVPTTSPSGFRGAGDDHHFTYFGLRWLERQMCGVVVNRYAYGMARTSTAHIG